MTTVAELKSAVSAWNNIRWDAQKVEGLMKNGTFFKISRTEFDTWAGLSKTPTEIHAYPAIFGTELKFIVIDGTTDKSPITDQSLPYIFEKDFGSKYGLNEYDFLSTQINGNINVDDALKRVMRWGIMMQSWIKDATSQSKDKGVFRVFNIPYEDLYESFKNKSVTELIVNMALKPQGGGVYDADLILWSNIGAKDNGGGDMPVQNVVAPCPPYCGGLGDYNLLFP
jgi:hypothetical protein